MSGRKSVIEWEGAVSEWERDGGFRVGGRGRVSWRVNEWEREGE